MNGGLEIGFDACPLSGRTRLSHLHQMAPLRALFPLCTGMDLPVAVTTSTSGGFAGGDRMDLSLRIGARADAMGGQSRIVTLVAVGGDRVICGFSGTENGPLES